MTARKGQDSTTDKTNRHEAKLEEKKNDSQKKHHLQTVSKKSLVGLNMLTAPTSPLIIIWSKTTNVWLA